MWPSRSARSGRRRAAPRTPRSADAFPAEVRRDPAAGKLPAPRTARRDRPLNSPLQGQCDLQVARSLPGGSSRHQSLVLATTILASSLAFVDGSVVNVGLPAI